MARSIKKGIDYFSLDVDIFADRKLRRVLHAHGAGAMAVVLRALCCVYGENGYYAQTDDDFYFDISEELALDEPYVRTVIAGCVAAGVFDTPLFDRYGVLTSRRIQRNYMDATKRRENAAIDPAYLLLKQSPSETVCNNGGNVCSNDENVCNNGGNVCSGTQSKVKKIKQEKTKQGESAPPAYASAGAPETKAHSAGGSAVSSPDSLVCLSDGERAALNAEFGAAAAARMIEMLGSYKGASGKRYKSDYCAIRSWVIKRWREENARGPTAAHFACEHPPEDYDHLAVNLFADDG